MLSRLSLIPLALAAAVSVLPQERVKKKEPADFGALVDKAKAAYQAGSYGACIKNLQSATTLAVGQRTKAIRAALPAAPAGYEIQPEDDPTADQPLLGVIALGVGSTVQRTYDPTGGGGSIDVSVTADSPMMQMFQLWITNPAMLPPDAELVKYGPHSAILQKEDEGATRNLKVVMAGDLLEVSWPNADEDALFAMFDQKAVDALAAVLAK